MGKAKSLNGKDLMLWISEKVIALSTSCKINLAATTVDSATKDDGFWDAQEVGNMNWSATNESVDSADKDRTNDYVYDELFKLFVAGKPIDVTVGLPSNKSDEGLPEDGCPQHLLRYPRSFPDSSCRMQYSLRRITAHRLHTRYR